MDDVRLDDRVHVLFVDLDDAVHAPQVELDAAGSAGVAVDAPAGARGFELDAELVADRTIACTSSVVPGMRWLRSAA